MLVGFLISLAVGIAALFAAAGIRDRFEQLLTA